MRGKHSPLISDDHCDLVLNFCLALRSSSTPPIGLDPTHSAAIIDVLCDHYAHLMLVAEGASVEGHKSSMDGWMSLCYAFDTIPPQFLDVSSAGCALPTCSAPWEQCERDSRCQLVY